MDYSTGDIVVYNAGTWGHVGMCYDATDPAGVKPTRFIHGTNSRNFCIENRTRVFRELE